MTGASSNLPTPRTRAALQQRPSSGQSMSRSRVSSPHDRAKLSSSRSTVSLASRHSKSFSAPVPISFAPNSNMSGVDEGEEERGDTSRQSTPPRSARSRSSRAEGESYQAGIYNRTKLLMQGVWHSSQLLSAIMLLILVHLGKSYAICAPPTPNTVIFEQLIASEIEVKVHHYVIRYYTTIVML